MVSTCLLAVFCTGGVVLVYQLCLRWLGRERLEGLMTTAQVLITMGIILGSQAVPYLIGRYGKVMAPAEGTDAWWVYTLPPAWFAGFDDALAGSGAKGAWMLGGFGVLATATVVGLAFGKLARSYATGWQMLIEARTATPRQRSRRRWLSGWVRRRPLRWLLRDSVTRGSFLLTIAYLLRDRDVKLRLYPGLAPMIVIPLVFLVRDISQESAGGTSGFGVAFAGGYLGIIPLVGLNLMQYSQQWQAADIFRAAPLPGPARVSQGACWAILCFLAAPLLMLLALMVALAGPHSSHWPLLLPGMMGLPIYAMIPCLNGKGVPLSLPIEEAKSVGQGLSMFGVMIVSIGWSGLSMLAWKFGWFWWFLLAEAVAVMAAYGWMRFTIDKTCWRRSVDKT
jgi:hypothetical protein